jgi:hypothetical protein
MNVVAVHVMGRTFIFTMKLKLYCVWKAEKHSLAIWHEFDKMSGDLKHGCPNTLAVNR